MEERNNNFKPPQSLINYILENILGDSSAFSPTNPNHYSSPFYFFIFLISQKIYITPSSSTKNRTSKILSHVNCFEEPCLRTKIKIRTFLSYHFFMSAPKYYILISPLRQFILKMITNFLLYYLIHKKLCNPAKEKKGEKESAFPLPLTSTITTKKGPPVHQKIPASSFSKVLFRLKTISNLLIITSGSSVQSSANPTSFSTIVTHQENSKSRNRIG